MIISGHTASPNSHLRLCSTATAHIHALKWELTANVHDLPVCDTVVSYNFAELKFGIYYYLKGIFNAYLNWFWRVSLWFIGPVGGFQENTDAVIHSPALSHTGVYNQQINVYASGGTSETPSLFKWPPTLAALET